MTGIAVSGSKELNITDDASINTGTVLGGFTLNVADGATLDINALGARSVAQISNFTNLRDVELDQLDFTLQDSLANLQAAEEVREAADEYALTNALLDAGTVTVAQAQAAYTAVQGLINGATNSDELEVGDLLTWSINSGAGSIIAAQDQPWITGADTISLTNAQITQVQADVLNALGNVDIGDTDVVSNDTVITVTLEEAVDGQDIEGALPESYAVDATVFAAGAVSVAAAGETFAQVETAIENAVNSEDLVVADLFTWSIEDSASAVLDDVSSPVIVGASRVNVTDDTITLEQYQSLDALDNYQRSGETVEYSFTQALGDAEAGQLVPNYAINTDSASVDAGTVTVSAAKAALASVFF
ncbi:hypothetical protein HLB35_14540 [Halomonas sp. TBZ9]|uniref:Uncharacterized protein n=1 Tax=Vreelandella azerica TaxID=2732867 RepID=A0A7Y3TYN9_9GAMM|nr:hypothetical protein [Halomonas azerica]NOG32672.1 hypothetical protein [Halomonas azerica]